MFGALEYEASFDIIHFALGVVESFLVLGNSHWQAVDPRASMTFKFVRIYFQPRTGRRYQFFSDPAVVSDVSLSNHLR